MYKSKTGNKNASRANFYDISDFIGWYTTQSENIVGISKNDFYNQYLAYHEGHGGWHANQIQDSIYNWLIKNPADIILLHIGTNDLNKEESPTIIIQEINQILSEVDRYEEKRNIPKKIVKKYFKLIIISHLKIGDQHLGYSIDHPRYSCYFDTMSFSSCLINIC